MSDQIITNELRQWIIEQAKAGCKPDAVLQSMRDAGWSEDVAIAAMESTLQGHLAGQVVQQAPLAAVPVPDPDLTESPLLLDVGDRQVHVLGVMQLPRVIMFGGLLSDEECDQLVELAKPKMARSMTVVNATGGEEVHPDRTSTGMFFQRGGNDLVKVIEARLARLVNWPVEYGEGLQILNYQAGAEYKPHNDYFDPDQPGTPTILKRGGQRVGTIIIYLNNPEKGGGTTFPDVQFQVAPKKGNAVFFSYDKPHASTKTLHGGAPVIAGEKWIATKWLREGVFT